MRQKKLGRWGVASTCEKPRHAHRRPCPPIAMLHRRSNACRLPVWRGLQGSRRLVRSGTTRDLPSAQSPPAARVCGSIFFFSPPGPLPVVGSSKGWVCVWPCVRRLCIGCRATTLRPPLRRPEQLPVTWVSRDSGKAWPFAPISNREYMELSMALGTSSTGRDLLPVTLSLADSASPTDSAPAAVTESTGSFDCDSPVPAVATMDEPALTAR